MDREALLALLAALSPETDEAEIRKAHEFVGGEIASLRATAKTLEDAETLRALRADQDKLQAELQRRVDEATAVQEALDATAAELTPPAPAAPAPAAAGDGTPPPPPPVASGDPEGDEGDEGEGEGADDKEKELVTAAARTAAREGQPPTEQAPSDGGKQPLPFVWAAAPGQGVINHGTPLDKAALARLFDDARTKSGESPGTYVVASIPSYEELGTPVLNSRDGVTRSDEIAKGVQARWAKEHGLAHSPDRVTAAICEPFEVIRELAPFQGVTDTPFADVFPSAPMARLGVRLTKRTWTLADMDAAFAMPWTGQDSVDEAVPSTWKPCITIPCPETFDITAEELTACFKVRDDTSMSSPETVDDFQELLFIQRARRREQYLLAKFDAHTETTNLAVSEGVFNSGVDALPKLLEVILTALGHVQYPNRIDIDNYVLVMPPNLDKILRIGRTKRAFGDTLMTRGDVEAQIRDFLGVSSIVWLRDNRNGGVGTQPQSTTQAAAADGNPEQLLADGFLDTLNRAYRVRLVSPGDAIYAVVGAMQTGLETDPQLLRQNMRQFFLKEWVGFGKNGPNPWLTVDFSCLEPNGGSVGFVTPVACAAAS